MLIDFLTLWILDAQVGEQQHGFFQILQHGATAPDAPLMTDEPAGDETAEPSNREFIDEGDKFVEEFVIYWGRTDENIRHRTQLTVQLNVKHS